MVSVRLHHPTKLDFETLDAFHRDSGQPMQPTGDYPFRKAGGSEVLYRTLVEEEFEELKEAMYKLVEGSADDGTCTIKDFADIAKEGLDVIVVIIGLLKSLGIPIKECWDELDRELASKRLPDGTFLKREDGKVLKPDTFKKANFVKVLTEAHKSFGETMNNVNNFYK
jgi:predicted HAD superfamily Cof-like phosphohydrolase